jgi:DNA-binding NarL/FixJ family response regulator
MGDKETTLHPERRRTMTTTLLRSELDQLSPRELEVLELMAEGRSNRAIGEELTVELKTVETHVGRVFTKLGLHEGRLENRRVLAVLTYVGAPVPQS